MELLQSGGMIGVADTQPQAQEGRKDAGSKRKRKPSQQTATGAEEAPEAEQQPQQQKRPKVCKQKVTDTAAPMEQEAPQSRKTKRKQQQSQPAPAQETLAEPKPVKAKTPRKMSLRAPKLSEASPVEAPQEADALSEGTTTPEARSEAREVSL